MSLPALWVNKIFEKLTLVYGHDFLRRWEGLDMRSVKADWAEELSGLHVNPDAIAHGLAHLPPGQPPTVLQFRALCISRPDPSAKRLGAPRATDEKVAAAIEKAKLSIPASRMNLEWAHSLRKREQMCDRLTAAQRAMWREALGENRTTEGAIA